ncbi:T-cell surface glycoprotein CD8 alpha chain isoform X8 [Lagopus muta]|uniref:T-cell surface glycoprotein CD8 alpha chain isoform X5 n=1 Tax=Lagopus muta TaxID=64668 RepID=UPI00209D48AB|nr:T-cell surface glycoprotein CD8 alpha chain isoform X5 [Lagopus muta]XP_048797172.1 T-cell surface glycoprotein CD8 alpha chain isoform X6 [Lagopus muta]XP_048797173.1 T-cell surface glycoprotein CD8 alpha chain isoform X7 [Lagopus muta]XP_048797174.1 T-cell surface glycoprotein CD8 alpha chain isoform X8 [Lagopus muta]
MAGSPALLLLLSLGLCCTSAQGQRNKMEARFLDRNLKHPQEGQRLELECLPYNRDNGVSWVRQDKDGKLHFITYIPVFSRTTDPGSKTTSSQFEWSKQENSFRLVVKNFKAQDQGTYFCISNINQVLHFSSGQPAFFPVTTTSAPTTPAATNQSSQISKTDICMQSSDPGTSNKNMLNFYCEIYIWAPLAGVCLVLLVVLVVTIVLCQKTRRRRCRCKRPPNGKPGAKPSVPTRHI